MKNSLGMSAGEVLDNWFQGRADDDDLLALFMPASHHSPFERMRRMAQAMNLGQQLLELSRASLLREAHRTADAVEDASNSSYGSENSLQMATTVALNKHFDALQMMAQAFEDVDSEKVMEALDLAEQAEFVLRETNGAVGLVREHLQRA